ncbi:hypothetical protein [Pseudomonas sp. Irchel 3A5]|uniref:hypothetical protein n=1 Tax=Pseudomonas sp. Irchel 3A5 TaxID=2008911 RepID=UPI000BA3F15E|nr:hypothetical protein [Pseudomonas sp. Irchel 3A5]
MQAQHLIIMAVLLPLSWVVLGYFVWRAIVRIHRRHAAQTQLLHAEIERLLQQQRDHERMVKTVPFTVSDRSALINIAQTLELAARTWKGLRATEQAARATAHQQLLNQFASRIHAYLASSKELSSQPLDTQLIEWLNEHGDLWGELETSTIRFPHEAATEGYQHLRDALREAFELDTKHRALRNSLPQAEYAA